LAGGDRSVCHLDFVTVYSFAPSPDSKSQIWVVGADGKNAHPITGKNEDALHPAFSPDDSKVFYAASSFTGHYSPIVRSARHDWDVFSIPVQPYANAGGPAPTRTSRIVL
jgi:Tol biopolymer transport system component